jgi:hypothetical protein
MFQEFFVPQNSIVRKVVGRKRKAVLEILKILAGNGQCFQGISMGMEPFFNLS